jgi:hypothetical protein
MALRCGSLSDIPVFSLKETQRRKWYHGLQGLLRSWHCPYSSQCRLFAVRSRSRTRTGCSRSSTTASAPSPTVIRPVCGSSLEMAIASPASPTSAPGLSSRCGRAMRCSTSRAWTHAGGLCRTLLKTQVCYVAVTSSKGWSHSMAMTLPVDCASTRTTLPELDSSSL